MKNLKKILCTLLALTLIVTSFGAISVMAEETEETTEAVETTKFPDVPKSVKYADAVEVLSKLSIINGYPDGTFQPENNVTRAEFAALLLRMLGMDQTMAPLENPFPDVDKTFWAAGTIDAAKRLGIITGYDDGTFGPENNVAYEEALTMIIRAINYSNYSAPGEMWYSTYVESANRLDITKDAIGNVGNPATRACIAQFIYNTLEVNVRENDIMRDQTIMEKHLGIEKKEGIIASNSYTSLQTPDVNLKENEVMIMDAVSGTTETYRVDNLSEYDDMIGAKITFYSRSSKSSAYDEIVMFSVKKSVEKQTIDASLLEDSKCNDTTIAYYKNKKTSSVSVFNLDAKNVVIFNGKLYGDSAMLSSFSEVLADDKLPSIGQISVLNRDNDNDYDVVFIDAYEHYAVSSVVSSTYTVTDKITSTEGKSVVLDYTDDDQVMAFVNTSGSKLSFSSIRKNVAIAVKESNPNSGTKLITVVIMDKSVSGEVTAISSSGLKIGSTEYEYSSIAAWKVNDEIKAPEKGDKYTFFLDVNGKIFAYVKNESADDGAKYGYIIGFKGNKDNSMSDEPIYLQILTQTGTKTWIPFAKNTKINGDSIDGDYERAEEILMEEAEKQALYDELENQAARQLIKYTLKTSSGTTVFDKITTVTDEFDTSGSSEIDDDELKMFGGFKSDEEAAYNSSNKKFSANGKNLFLGSAIVFVVPQDMSETDDYKKGSSSDFKHGKYYYIDAFDISTSSTAKVVVLYGGSSVTEVSAKTAAFRVEEWYEEENETKGDTMIKIEGYENASSTLKEYWVSPSTEDAVKDLVTGDVVRFGLDSDGFVTLAEDDILYTADLDPYYFAWEEDYTVSRPETNSELKKAKAYENADFKVILGTLASVNDEDVIVVVEEDDDITDIEIAFRMPITKFNSAAFYEYDTSSDPVEITKMDGDSKEVLESLATLENNGGDAARVFVHVVSGQVKSVSVITEK
ncbi:MAG: S-layer homology domain-containing protein [Ruminococcaceae bacterium]|nr:S-layer homology domain-containing protein [Oscillospiraceae bacterium]